MANDNHKTPETNDEPVYLYSEQAHDDLRSVQDSMFLLSLLTQSRQDEPLVPMTAWTGFFNLVGTHIRGVLDQAPWREAA